jgi:hypothetical protein
LIAVLVFAVAKIQQKYFLKMVDTPADMDYNMFEIDENPKQRKYHERIDG